MEREITTPKPRYRVLVIPSIRFDTVTEGGIPYPVIIAALRGYETAGWDNNKYHTENQGNYFKKLN